MRQVLLIGGPYDGKATDVTDDLPPYWRLAWLSDQRPVVRPLPKADPLDGLERSPFKVATYRRELVNWGSVKTKVIVYIFAEVS